LEAVDPVVEREAERAELRLVPARAEPQDEATAGDLVDRRGLLREERRVVERRARDERPDRRLARRRRERGHERPGLPRATGRAALPAVEEMLADPDRVEAQVVDRAGEVDELRPADLSLDLGQLHPDAEWPRHRPVPWTCTFRVTTSRTAFARIAAIRTS